jgi:hypothetical protein
MGWRCGAVGSSAFDFVAMAASETGRLAVISASTARRTRSRVPLAPRPVTFCWSQADGSRSGRAVEVRLTSFIPPVCGDLVHLLEFGVPVADELLHALRFGIEPVVGGEADPRLSPHAMPLDLMALSGCRRSATAALSYAC